MGGGLCTSGVACNSGTPTHDATRAAGVGVIDIMNKIPDPNNNWAGLVRYDLEVANVVAGNLDPNGRVLFNTLFFVAVTGQTDITQPGLTANGDPTGQVMRNKAPLPKV